MTFQNHTLNIENNIEMDDLRELLGNEIYIEFWLDTFGDIIAFPEFSNN